MGFFDHKSEEAEAHAKVSVLSLPLFQFIERLELIVPWYLFKVMESPHKGHLSHELIAAAASYEVYCKRLSIILSYLNQLFPLPGCKSIR